MAPDFRGLQFTVEFMVLGVWQSPSHGRVSGSREGASTGRYTLQDRTDLTLHRFHSLPSGATAEDYHEVR